jgi:arabinogalactan endo-1,4-beta-galactosidase
MKKIALVAAVFAVFACSPAAKDPVTPAPDDPTPVTPEDPTPEDPTPEEPTVTVPAFAKGADIGWASEMEAGGRKFVKKDGTSAALLDVLKDCGINAIRLRVWVNPYKGWSGKEDVVAVGKKVTAAGLPLMVDFHYSDFFADPSRQKIPAAWEADSGDMDKMCQHVTDHTTEVLKALTDAGVSVNWIQIGNETRGGMLFPLGQLIYSNKGSEFAGFVKLYNAGFNAAKAVCPKALVMPHIDKAFDASNDTWWLTNFKNQGGKFDMVALSHYPQESWDGNTQLDANTANTRAIANIRSLHNTLKVPIMVSEVGVKTPAGEATAKQVLKAFVDELKQVEGCAGVFYWEPEVDGSWRPEVYTKPTELTRLTGVTQSGWWNAYGQGAFTTGGKPTSVLDVFAD